MTPVDFLPNGGGRLLCLSQYLCADLRHDLLFAKVALRYFSVQDASFTLEVFHGPLST